MLDVTRWLAGTFREYERRVESLGQVDEHSLRQRLMAGSLNPGVDQVIVTVADWVAEPDGLFVSDFDLLARLPGLGEVDIVSTDAILASGFHERLREWLPEIDEQSAADIGGTRRQRPRLIVPAPYDQQELVSIRVTAKPVVSQGLDVSLRLAGIS